MTWYVKIPVNDELRGLRALQQLQRLADEASRAEVTDDVETPAGPAYYDSRRGWLWPQAGMMSLLSDVRALVDTYDQLGPIDHALDEPLRNLASNYSTLPFMDTEPNPADS